MTKHTQLITKMMEHERGNPHRIQHFLKVLAFSEQIGRMEGIDDTTFYTLQAAAIVHDIGILPSLEKHGSGAGKYQELEGPLVSRPMMAELGYSEAVIDRVAYLVGHHHTYDNIDGIDYQILVEADFLVNLFEGQKDNDAKQAARKNIFRTKSGTEIFDLLFPME